MENLKLKITQDIGKCYFISHEQNKDISILFENRFFKITRGQYIDIVEKNNAFIGYKNKYYFENLEDAQKTIDELESILILDKLTE